MRGGGCSEEAESLVGREGQKRGRKEEALLISEDGGESKDTVGCEQSCAGHCVTSTECGFQTFDRVSKKMRRDEAKRRVCSPVHHRGVTAMNNRNIVYSRILCLFKNVYE